MCVLLLLAGCEDSVAPVSDAGRPFTLYGVLDPTQPRQALRVVAFRGELASEEPLELDAEVTSVDLEAGEAIVWEDSVLSFGGGRIGHVFHAEFRAAYGHAYRIEVRRSDGAVSSAEVTVPPLVEPLPLEAERTGAIVLASLWPGAPELNEARVTYVVQDGECDVHSVSVPASLPAKPFEFGWRAETDLVKDAEAVFAALAPASSLRLRGVRMGAQVASTNWYPPGGVFDPEVLVDPLAFTNVHNGFGFVGAGYTLEVPVPVPAALREQVGFHADGPGC